MRLLLSGLAAFICLNPLRAVPLIERLATGFSFTEGPALNAKNEVYFTDISNKRIYIWSESEGVRIFKENSGGANGLMFDRDGNLLACEGASRQLTRITPEGSRNVLAERIAGKRLNSPNDLWVTPGGGIYFTDPRYGKKRADMEQEGEHVYYLSPDRSRLMRVIDDMTRPNGLIGTPDGKTLYVADHGGKQTYRYSIEADGSLGNKSLFAKQASDGMSIDDKGCVYLTDTNIDVYAPDGTHLQSIPLPERPANVCVINNSPRTLFATARTSIYRITLED